MAAAVEPLKPLSAGAGASAPPGASVPPPSIDSSSAFFRLPQRVCQFALAEHAGIACPQVVRPAPRLLPRP